MTEAQRSLAELKELHRQARLTGVRMSESDCAELNRLQMEIDPPQIFPAKTPDSKKPLISKSVAIAAPAAQALTKSDLDEAIKKQQKHYEWLVFLLAVCIWHPIGWAAWGLVFVIWLAYR